MGGLRSGPFIIAVGQAREWPGDRPPGCFGLEKKAPKKEPGVLMGLATCVEIAPSFSI